MNDDMVLPGLKGNNMEALLIVLYTLFFASFVIWIYFCVQSIRGKHPLSKMWIWVVVINAVNIAIQIAEKGV